MTEHPTFQIRCRHRAPVPLWRVLLEAMLVVSIVFCGVRAFGQDAPPNPNDGPMRVTVLAGAVTSLAGADDTANIKGAGWIDAQMPVGWSRPYARVGISTRPEETFDFTNVATFSSAEVGLGLERAVGLSSDGLGRVGLIVEGGFSSIVSGEPADKLARYVFGGVKFSHASGGEIAVGYGLDEQAGPWGLGQIVGYGALPIGVTADVIVLTGDFVLSLQHNVGTRDVLKLGIMIDLGRAMAAIKAGAATP